MTNAVLAYSYSIGDAYYSGEIKLAADDSRVETIERELIGQQVQVHYNPKKPAKSIFLKHSVKGWAVVDDARISLLSALDNPR